MSVCACRYAVRAYPSAVLAQLRALLVILEGGRLYRAAIRLRIAQSTLSQQMQVLEADIGGALLERTTTGVRPTDAGHALASSVPRVLAEYDAVIAEARRLARGQRDLIRVGYLGSAARDSVCCACATCRAARASCISGSRASATKSATCPCTRSRNG